MLVSKSALVANGESYWLNISTEGSLVIKEKAGYLRR